MTTIKEIKRFFTHPARLGLMAAAGLMAGGALADGFDGLTLVTNAWFAADFTRLTAGTVITQGSTTGISSGAGSWTSVPASATAQIVADAGGEATLLSINAEEGELTFTPAALATATGMATVTVDVKTIAVDTLPTPEGGAQGAFAIYSPDGEAHSLAAYVSDGTAGVWTNLVYAAGADTLTNAWFALTLDFATVSNVRYVRYSLTPPNGSLTVLEDAAGTQWFRSADDDATTVASVSFTGTGNIRTFSGDSLAEPVATCNGENFATVADAIAAAEEGGTVTLVKAVTDGTLTISKNVMLDFNGKAISLDGIVINEGKTLTVTRANSNNNVIPTITGGGNLVVSGNNTFAWKGMAGTSSLATITQNDSGSGGIAITGHGTINVTGDVNVRAALTFSPSSAEAAYVSDGFTIKMAANSVSAGTLNGGATIETEEGTTVGGGTFYGVVKGGLAASGNFVSQGAGLDGTIAVADGRALTIGNRLASMSNIRFHLDATDSATYALEDETSNLTQIKGGDSTYSLESGSAAAVLNAGDVNHFGGQPYFQFDGSSYARGNKVCAMSYIAVVHPDSLGGYLARYSDQDRLGTSSTAWFARCYGNNRDGWLTQNGTTDRTASAGVDTIISLLTRITASDNREDHLGTSYVGAIAEYVGFNSAISVEDRVACEMYLMDKWNLAAAANFRPFASTAKVELGAGSTLDLGGLVQKLQSVSGSGIISNGTLTVVDPISVAVGNSLVIPYGSTYTRASGVGEMVDESAGTITLKHCAADIDGVVYDTVADAILAYESGTLTIHESATLDFGTTEVSASNVVLDDGVTLTLTQNLPWTSTYDGDAGTIVNTRVASTYVWTPVESSTDWATLSNWRISSATPVALPGANDTVSFASSGTVTLSANVDVGTLSIADAIRVQFTAESLKNLVIGDYICGSGTTNALSNIKLVPQEKVVAYTLDIGGIVEIVDGTDNQIRATSHRVDGNNKPAMTLTISGNLIGGGNVEFGSNSGASRAYVNLSGDNSGFTGVATINGNNTGSFRWMSADSGSASARWVTINGPTMNFGFTSGTLKLGSFETSTGVSLASNSTPSLEIGGYGNDSELSSNFARGSGSRSLNLVKVGSGKLVFSGRISNGNGNGNITVENGTFDIAASQSLPNAGAALTMTGGILAVSGTTTDAEENTVFVDPSAYIKNCTTYPITFSNAVDEVHIWSTALASSNTRGLVKKGAGTLTLAAAPGYTGTTTVEAGTLVVTNGTSAWEYTLGADTKASLAMDGDIYVYTLTPLTSTEKPEAVEGVITVPEWMDGVSAVYAITPGESIDCSKLTIDATGIKATVSTTVGGETVDMTSYYTSSSLGVVNGSITPQLDENEVGVKLGDDDEGVAAPVTFTDTNPTFKLKNSVKKGLYYGVGTISDPTAENPSVTILVEKRATTDGQEISLEVPSPDFSSGNVIYYKLSVSDTEQ